LLHHIKHQIASFIFSFFIRDALFPVNFRPSRLRPSLRPRRLPPLPPPPPPPPLQFLGVYVPNCGGKGGFDRRRAWDEDMKRFVCCSRSKPLMLCGDLNVAPQWEDVSHPKWFRRAPAPTTPLLPLPLPLPFTSILAQIMFYFSGNAIAPMPPTLATAVNQAHDTSLVPP
jgi:hypothetical protein